ncbi:hypothetical protein D918_07778 [Trichuris suis]|nr:hypothetical protein D918_07778 [Trichuris suis]
MVRPRGDTRVARGGNPRRGGGGPHWSDRPDDRRGFGPKGGDRESPFGGGRGRGRGDFRGQRGGFQSRGGMKIRGGRSENRGDFSRGKQRASFSNRGGASFGSANQGMQRGFHDGKSVRARGGFGGGKRRFQDEETTNKKRKFSHEMEQEEEDVQLSAEELSNASSLDDSDLEEEESVELDLSGEEVPAEGVSNNDQGTDESDLGANSVSTSTPVQPMSLGSDEQETFGKTQAKKGEMMKKKEKQKGKAKPAKASKMEAKGSKLAKKNAAKGADQKKGTLLASIEPLMEGFHDRPAILATSKVTPPKKVAADSFEMDKGSDESDLDDEDISDEIDLGSEELSEEVEEEDEQSEEEMKGKVASSMPAQASKPAKGVLKKGGKDVADKEPAKQQPQKPVTSATTKAKREELEAVQQEEKILAEEIARLRKHDACRLFVNHLPKGVTVEDVKSAVPGALDLFKPFRNDAKYGFLIFADEATTTKQYAKLKDKLKIKDKAVAIDYCGHKGAKGAKELSPLVYKLQLFISDLPAQANTEQVKELFPKAKNVEVMARSRYGLVNFNTPEEAREAFDSGSKMSLNGVPITVLYSRPRKVEEKQNATKQTKQKTKKRADKLDKSISEAQCASSVEPSAKEETPKKADKKPAKPTPQTTPVLVDMKSDDDDDDEGVESDDDELDLDDDDDDEVINLAQCAIVNLLSIGFGRGRGRY